MRDPDDFLAGPETSKTSSLVGFYSVILTAAIMLVTFAFAMVAYWYPGSS